MLLKRGQRHLLAADIDHVGDAAQDAKAAVDTNGSAFDGSDVHTTLTNFRSGAGGDIVQIQKNGASISSGGFQTIALADTNVTQTTVVYNSGLVLQEEGRGIVAVDHDQLRFDREAGIVRSRHLEPSPALRLLTTELRRIAARRRDN